MVLHIRVPTDGDTGIASEFLFVGGDTYRTKKMEHSARGKSRWTKS